MHRSSSLLLANRLMAGSWASPKTDAVSACESVSERCWFLRVACWLISIFIPAGGLFKLFGGKGLRRILFGYLQVIKIQLSVMSKMLLEVFSALIFWMSLFGQVDFHSSLFLWWCWIHVKLHSNDDIEDWRTFHFSRQGLSMVNTKLAVTIIAALELGQLLKCQLTQHCWYIVNWSAICEAVFCAVSSGKDQCPLRQNFLVKGHSLQYW